MEEEKRLSAVAIDVNMRDRKCLQENLFRNMHMLLLTCGGRRILLKFQAQYRFLIRGGISLVNANKPGFAVVAAKGTRVRDQEYYVAAVSVFWEICVTAAADSLFLTGGGKILEESGADRKGPDYTAEEFGKCKRSVVCVGGGGECESLRPRRKAARKFLAGVKELYAYAQKVLSFRNWPRKRRTISPHASIILKRDGLEVLFFEFPPAIFGPPAMRCRMQQAAAAERKVDRGQSHFTLVSQGKLQQRKAVTKPGEGGGNLRKELEEGAIK